ncbi:MAG: hypothetical protein ACI9E4_001158, partial [Pseudohongiellaceae bacterium]
RVSLVNIMKSANLSILMVDHNLNKFILLVVQVG